MNNLKRTREDSIKEVNETNYKQPFHLLDEQSIVDKKLSSLTLMPNQFSYKVDCSNNSIVEHKGNIKDLLGVSKFNHIEVLQERIHDRFVDKYAEETISNLNFALKNETVFRIPLRNIFHSTIALQKKGNDLISFMRQTFFLRSDKNGIFTHTGAIFTLIEGVKVSPIPFDGHKVFGKDSLLFKNEQIAAFQNIFSTREMQVLALIAEGFNNRSIGEKLFISEKTVQTHRKNMLAKLKAKSTAHLIAMSKDMCLI